MDSMETSDPGPADGEERPRTRSNPEGAEDRRSSNGSLNSTPPPQPAVGSRVEGEGEASSTDGAPNSTSTITTTVPAQAAAAAATTTASVTAPVSAATDRPKAAQPSVPPPMPPPVELQIRAPRVNCPEKVVSQKRTVWTEVW